VICAPICAYDQRLSCCLAFHVALLSHIYTAAAAAGAAMTHRRAQVMLLTTCDAVSGSVAFQNTNIRDVMEQAAALKVSDASRVWQLLMTSCENSHIAARGTSNIQKRLHPLLLSYTLYY
jgi:hypothetical protein